MSRSRFLAWPVALILVVLTPVYASAGSSLRAELHGTPLPLAAVADHHCHDFAHPVIRCFASAPELEADVAARRIAAAGRTAGAAALTYVRVWDLTWYAGASMFISQNYSNLGTVGWNNRVSSYAAQNSQSGEFFTNTFGGGAVDPFCCSQSVPTLSSTLNNAFSSVYRT